MAKRKSTSAESKLLKQVREGSYERGPERKLTSSGIEVIIRPFPAGLWEDVTQKALELYPEPDIPIKMVDTVTEKEEAPDPENPEYLQAKQIAENERREFLFRAVLDICVEIDLSKYKSDIRRLEKYSIEKLPDDPDERRVRFLYEYVLRSKGDFEYVMTSATTQMMIDDPEVAERIKSFQNQVSRARNNNSETPSP